MTTMIISLTLGSFIACGDKEEDTGVVTDTATTEETDTEDTSDTEETDTEDTSDTEDEVVDADGDGIPASEDCDDSNADMPANDADCDGALTADDCDDNDAARYPSAEEIADDGIDQNCSTLELHLDTSCSSGAAVRLTGPWWGWDPNGSPEATKIADGHFQFTLDPAPGENMEFLFVVDGTQEGLLSAFDGDNVGPTCRAINTDYVNYFNRYWLAGSGDQEYVFNSCDAPVAE